MYLRRKLFNDLSRRQKYRKVEKQLLLYKMLYKNEYLVENIRLLAYNKYVQLNVKSSEIRNSCLITGRSRSIVTQFRISRHIFKEMVTTNKLTFRKF